jgi:hypothetical protein
MSSLLPVLEKSWYFNVNQFLYSQPGTQLNAQQLLWTIKQSFLSSPENPWQVVGSSNSVVGALDGVDRWIATTNLVWGNDGAAHSWIVLHQPALGGAAQLLFECTFAANGDFSGIRCMFSPTLGFTGGSNTTRPTAADEQGIMSGSGSATGGILPNNGNNIKVHFMQSSDGKCTRLFVTFGRNTLITAVFDTISGLLIPWNAPIVYMFISATNLSLLAMSDVNAPIFGMRVNGTPARGVLSVQGFGNVIATNYFTLQNEVTNRWAMYPLGIANNNTLNIRGSIGRFTDLWAGPWFDGTQLISKRTGDTYPADGSNQLAQFGPLLVPWGGNESPMTGKL